MTWQHCKKRNVCTNTAANKEQHTCLISKQSIAQGPDSQNTVSVLELQLRSVSDSLRPKWPFNAPQQSDALTIGPSAAKVSFLLLFVPISQTCLKLQELPTMKTCFVPAEKAMNYPLPTNSGKMAAIVGIRWHAAPIQYVPIGSITGTTIVFFSVMAQYHAITENTSNKGCKV